LIFIVSGTERKKHLADKRLKNDNHKIITIKVLPLKNLRGNISFFLFFPYYLCSYCCATLA
ncbi:hypothetical protein, partial [Enterobacter cloacae complex sp. P16RS2]|uniref:hypothetical protein n=1 Tax=Enterobacter cloacae complex sp. P16RS2 TaxID=2779577 RepID=UPI001D0BF0D8